MRQLKIKHFPAKVLITKNLSSGYFVKNGYEILHQYILPVGALVKPCMHIHLNQNLTFTCAHLEKTLYVKQSLQVGIKHT